VLAPGATADQGGRFEPVHVRHVDVEQDGGEVADEQMPQRVQTRFGRDDADAQRLQRDCEGQPLVRQVVH
jgi:hypothetical protein